MNNDDLLSLLDSIDRAWAIHAAARIRALIAERDQLHRQLRMDSAVLVEAQAEVARLRAAIRAALGVEL